MCISALVADLGTFVIADTFFAKPWHIHIDVISTWKQLNLYTIQAIKKMTFL